MMADALKPEKLFNYAWQGQNKAGNKVIGELSAPSVILAKAELRQQGILVRKIKKKGAALFGRNKKVSSLDISIFSRQLATMISASIPLVQCFEVISKGTTKVSLKAMIIAIKNEVESGTSLHQALSRYPKHFDALYCSLISTGEQSGSLEIMLERVAAYKERIEKIKRKVKKALFYPALVLGAAFLVIAILLIFVVPQFETLFQSFGAQLPVFTQMVIHLSRFFARYWWLIFSLIGLSIYFFISTKKKSVKFSEWLDKISLKLPIIGGILQKSAVARFSRTLAITFAAGLPLVDALKSVASAVGNSVYTKAVMRIRDEVAIGERIEAAMKTTDTFPSMVEQMIGIGEESGVLDIMLNKIADFYEEDVSAAVDNLSSLLEPLIMIVLGVLVGGLVVAMYLPIFKLGSIT